MRIGFTAAQRRLLETVATDGVPMPCPACGGELTVNELQPSRQVSYVRHRVWVICVACRRAAAVDLRSDR